MDIDAKDCRLEGISNATGTAWLRGTYLPLGIVVTREGQTARGIEGKRRLMESLQHAVNRHMDNELAKLR